MDRARVLVVDDELSMRQFLEILLKKEGYLVTTASDGEAALRCLEEKRHAVVLMDYNMPGGIDGISLLNRMRQVSPATQIIVITAYASTEQAIKSLEIGALDYVSKPFNVAQIRDLVRRAVNEYFAADQGAVGRGVAAEAVVAVVAESPAMKQVLEYADKVAPTDSIVLLTGESGVGKEVIARYIHDHSPRREASWYPINCGAIPESLQESELFGYEKGAFTGADRMKRGYFEVVGSGTLFLDEVGELSENMQVKLLRVLQERVFLRVGGVEKIETRVRLIAATNKDLDQEVASGRVRADLFFRLNVFGIHVPPLRERREDIIPLAREFLSLLSQRMGREWRLEKNVEQFLVEYPFPGNVRELHNILELAAGLEKGSRITMDDIKVVRPVVPSEVRVSFNEPIDLDAVLADVERRHITAALDKAKQNRSEAARLLGITERSLRYRMDKLGLRQGDDE